MTASTATGVLEAIDKSGDTKTMWDADNKDEVEIAEATFKKLKAKGYAICRVKKNGEPGEIMHTFDPKAEKMVAIPPMQGG